MPVVMMYFMGFVKLFSKFGRYTDLIAGIVCVSLGAMWHSPWLIGGGVLSMAAFAFDLNGWVQRRSLAYAHGRIAKRRR